MWQLTIQWSIPLPQICSHPALIKSMLDPESRANEGLDGADGAEDIDLISQLSDMKIGGGGVDKVISCFLSV